MSQLDSGRAVFRGDAVASWVIQYEENLRY